MSSSEMTSIRIINQFSDMPQLFECIAGNEGWRYGIYPGLLGNVYPSWYIHLCGSRDLRDRSFHDNVLHATPGLKALDDLWSLVREELAPDYGLIRAYASGHTNGQEGIPHYYSKPSDHELVALLCLNQEWKDAWAGEIVFYDPAHECVSVRPRPGRLILFNGSIARVSRPPARECPTLCMTLSFHMRPLRFLKAAQSPGM
jgi:SM-20-related protein